jgi:AraC-like DNA-binding protein
MAHLVALVLDRTSQARIVDAMRGVATVSFCATAGEVRAAMAETRAEAVIVEPRDAQGALAATLIAELRRQFPAVAVLAYCTPAPQASNELLAAARAGANGILLRGYDDIGAALRSAIAASADECLARRVVRELGDALPTEVRPLVEHCIQHGRDAPSVVKVARALGVHRKTLFNRLARLGLPNPQILIGWCRLLLAAKALEETGKSVERVALDLDFPSATSFRGMLKRYTGLRPQEVRENGGVACVLHLFHRALRQHGASEELPADSGRRAVAVEPRLPLERAATPPAGA